MTDLGSSTAVDGEHDAAAAWRSLDIRQRILLVEEAAQHATHLPEYKHPIARALVSRGLMHEADGAWFPSAEGYALADWAHVHDPDIYKVARKLRGPAARPAATRKTLAELVDPQRLADLAAKGLNRVEIADQLQVSPMTVWRAARLHSIAIARKPAPQQQSSIDPADVAELAAQGVHAAEIARRLEVSPTTIATVAKRHDIDIPRKQPAPKPKPELAPYPWPDAWTKEQCAECWGIKLSTWESYCSAGLTPAPLPGVDEQRRRRWDPDEVKAVALTRPGSGHDRGGRRRARVGVGGRDEMARGLAEQWANSGGWVSEELVSGLDELARAYRLKV